MAVTMPSIEVVFKQLAGSLIERSERGIAILIIKDDTDKSFFYRMYKDATEVDKDAKKFTDENLKAIKDVLSFQVSKLYVYRIDATEGVLSDALKLIQRYVKTGWITIANGTTEEFESLTSWIKARELEHKSYKAVVYNMNTTDCMHLVNFCNEKVTFADERGEVEGVQYCPSLLGILASCNIKRGSTYYKCTNLTSVQEYELDEGTGDIEENRNKALAAGKFILFNDDEVVRIARGINSLTTTDGMTKTEDMKWIDIVETMDLISDDIANVFKETYLGNYKNNYDNQVLFISAINTYFKELEDDLILDNNYDNKADVDVEAQRLAWTGVGKTEAENWDEQTVKNNTFKRTVYLTGDIKILSAMEDLKFTVWLF
jgi:hypothetical protein|uniref:Tail protein n=1 Tax=Siphoviridae sp. ctVqj4 TaxID=2826359 RepID=A0A8S5NLW4_9CAUD|nr:MAG TPA: tail protein [Siphoviridae sp. ctVqj4]